MQVGDVRSQVDKHANCLPNNILHWLEICHRNVFLSADTIRAEEGIRKLKSCYKTNEEVVAPTLR